MKLNKLTLLFIVSLTALCVNSCKKDDIPVDDYIVYAEVSHGIVDDEDYVVAYPELTLSIDGPKAGEKWAVVVYISGEPEKYFFATTGSIETYQLDFSCFGKRAVRDTVVTVSVRKSWNGKELYSEMFRVRFDTSEPNGSDL